MKKFKTSEVPTFLVQNAKKVRSQARQLDAKSELDVRRTERARFLLLNSGKCKFYMVSGVDGWASCVKDELNKDGASCTCPDAQKGNLCKHVRVLAASVIEHAANLPENETA